MTIEERELAQVIIDIVCEYYEMTFDEICKDTRDGPVKCARQMLQTSLYDYFYSRNKRCSRRVSEKEIGWLVGHKDHATVNHSRRTMRNLVQNDPAIRREWTEIQDRIAMTLEPDGTKMAIFLQQLKKLMIPRGGKFEPQMKRARYEVRRLIQYLEGDEREYAEVVEAPAESCPLCYSQKYVMASYLHQCLECGNKY